MQIVINGTIEGRSSMKENSRNFYKFLDNPVFKYFIYWTNLQWRELVHYLENREKSRRGHYRALNVSNKPYIIFELSLNRADFSLICQSELQVSTFLLENKQKCKNAIEQYASIAVIYTALVVQHTT